MTQPGNRREGTTHSMDQEGESIDAERVNEVSWRDEYADVHKSDNSTGHSQENHSKQNSNTEEITSKSEIICIDNGEEDTSAEKVLTQTFQRGQFRTLADILATCRDTGLQKTENTELEKTDVGTKMKQEHKSDQFEDESQVPRRFRKRQKKAGGRSLADIIAVSRVEGKQVFNDVENVPETDRALVEGMKRLGIDLTNTKTHSVATSKKIKEIDTAVFQIASNSMYSGSSRLNSSLNLKTNASGDITEKSLQDGVNKSHARVKNTSSVTENEKRANETTKRRDVTVSVFG